MTLYHVDEQMCRQCGGLCCQGHAGSWVDPQRFERLFFNGAPLIRSALPAGVILRYIDGIEVPTPATREQGCTFFNSSGCSLTLEQRPCQCLALQPSIETLMEGEMCCTLPPACGTQTARENWQRYWADTERSSTTEG